MSLTQDDERTYWGKITEVGTVQDPDNNNNSSPIKVEIEGAIMLGTGLEPCSIGRFRMIEMEEDIIDSNEEDDIDQDEGDLIMNPEDIDMNAKRFDSLFRENDSEDDGLFDSPYGAFE